MCRISCCLLALVAPIVAAAQTEGRSIVERSAAALGGLERLRGVAAVRTVEEGLEYLIAVGDPRAAPWGIAETVTTLRRMTPVGLRQTTAGRSAMNDKGFVQTIVASDSVVSLGGTVAARAFEAAQAAEVMALSPDRILLTALAAHDVRALKDSVIDGFRHHVVEFPWLDARVQVGIDATTGFPDAVRLVRAYPTYVFWSMWGDMTVDTRWAGWSLESNGVWYPRQRSVTLNGHAWRRFVVTGIDVTPVAPPDSFAVADSVRGPFAAVAHAPAILPEPTLTPVTLADGVVLFKGYYQSTLVREPDGVVILDASQSNARSRAVLAQAARLFPGVPIKAVITTSAAWMQIGGAREYASRGIPIFALDVNAPTIRALLAAPYTRYPDSLARAKRAGTVRVVRETVALGSGPNELRLVPTSSGTLLVYWPNRHWVYAGDMIVPAAFEPNYVAARAATFGRVVGELGLTVDSVFAFHMPLAAWPP